MKKPVFDVVKAVKENSRLQLGTVPTTKVVPHKNKRADKHPKRALEQELMPFLYQG